MVNANVFFSVIWEFVRNSDLWTLPNNIPAQQVLKTCRCVLSSLIGVLRASSGSGVQVRLRGLPRPPYPTPFVGYLILYTKGTSHKLRYPEKRVGYKGVGKALLAKQLELMPPI